MADQKISALTSASTPLAGTEVLPIVQSGATVKVSVANLTVGRAVATAGGSFTDNITQSTAGKGINFAANTNAPGMTSELLNWYEEGTWTGTLTAVTPPTTPITATGSYTRIGRLVMYNINFINVDTTGSAGNASVTGLPFTAGETSHGTVVSNAFANPTSSQVGSGGTSIAIVISQTANNTSMTASTGQFVFITGVYRV
jgi:hypothetical protein